MDATPICFDTATPVSDAALRRDHGLDRQADAGDLRGKWQTLHAAAGTIAVLADCRDDAMSDDVGGFPDAVPALPQAHRQLATRGIDDLVAILEPGLAALLAVHASGADPVPAARALWDEFRTARDALIALARGPRGMA